MTVPLLMALLALIPLFLRLPAFEVVVGLMLIAPIGAQIFAPLGLPIVACYWVSMALAAGLLWMLRASPRASYDWGDELFPVALAGVCFVLFGWLCGLWPDFYPVGERLRDYALIAGTLRSPIDPQEPWMAGTTLNYYVLYYRLGDFIHRVVGLSPWSTYHQLCALAFSLYFVSVFRIFRVALRLRLTVALAAAVFAVLLPNAAGLDYLFSGKSGWSGYWSLSRVIPGTINEFPVWSFVLGDLHPHYLSLASFPLLLLFLIRLWEGSRSPWERLIQVLALALFSMGFLYNANAWELPFSGLALGAAVLGMFALVGSLRPVVWRAFWVSRSQLDPHRAWLIGAALVLLLTGLYLGGNHLQPSGLVLRWVTGEVGRSPLANFHMHWGIPLTIVPLALLVLSALGSRRIGLGWFLVFCAAFAGGDVRVLLIAFTLCGVSVFWQRLEELRKQEASEGEARPVILEAVGIAGLLLLLLVECVFIDDAYGGSEERMNTVFKVYAVAWFMVHAYAVALLARLYRSPKVEDLFLRFRVDFGPFLVGATAVVILGIAIWFGWRMVDFRRIKSFSIQPKLQGLSSVERRYTGASAVVKKLLKRTPKVVLEGQGPAYSYTTHIATLSGFPAYLGWANHMRLLSGDRREVDRRIAVTQTIYSGQDCRKKLALARKERISYIVVGPIEEERYPSLDIETFRCLTRVTKVGRYSLLAVPPEGPKRR